MDAEGDGRNATQCQGSRNGSGTGDWGLGIRIGDALTSDPVTQ